MGKEIECKACRQNSEGNICILMQDQLRSDWRKHMALLVSEKNMVKAAVGDKLLCNEKTDRGSETRKGQKMERETK